MERYSATTLIDFEAWFAKFFTIGFYFILLFFLIVPLGLTFWFLWKEKELAKEGLRSPSKFIGAYREWLLTFTHIFFSGIALLLTVFVAMSAIEYVATSHELNSISLQRAAQGQVTATTDRVLSLAEVMFGFFGLVLSLITVVAAIFSWWLRKNIEDATDKVNRLQTEVKEDVAKLTSGLNLNLEFARSSVIVAADIALMRLPDVTFSQQIPSSLMSSFRLLEKVWSEPQYWDAILKSDNGARVRYSRALYFMGNGLDWVMNVKESAAAGGTPHRTDIVSLLLDAKSLQIDATLGRNIRIRLFQAYRQAELFDKAKEILNELNSMRETVVFHWGSVVLHLQKGLKERNIDERRTEFNGAVKCAEQLVKDFRRSPSRETTAVHYYCAKALWSLRFSWGRNPEESVVTKNLLAELAKRFEQIADEANVQLEVALSGGIEDDVTKAIYLVSKAYLLIAWKVYPGTRNPPDPDPGSHRTSAWRDPKELLSSAKGLLDQQTNIFVYHDHWERIAPVNDFKIYIEELESFLEEDNLWKFYQLSV